MSTLHDRVVALEPAVGSGWNERGDVLLDLGRYENAIRSFEKAIDIDPDDYYAWYGKACIEIKTGKIEDGLLHLEKPIKFGGEDYVDMARKDEFLDVVKNDERFKKMIG